MRLTLAIVVSLSISAAAAEPKSVSGIYPSLAMFNDEGECGTGAVVPFADRLWVITYGPHLPLASSDKLYEITPDLRQIVRPESVGGTNANRLIHRESNQLFIGRHAIGADGTVRTIAPQQMFGRMTGTARHLTDAAGKVLYATMEEGLYEVDVKTLQPTELWADEQVKKGRHADLPGYHGKGLYTGQGRIVYANNGDRAKEALSNPTVPSGVLASWNGEAPAWEVVRRNQFTEVTGPGGIHGSADPAKDPMWTIGWDHKSLILMLLERGQWHSFRLPKASHSYDGAHGWNTEWPRIRDIGEKEHLLMTMHGTFWSFPKGFRLGQTAGISPRSNYLKVIGDFCHWQDRVVFGCDDTAKSEFLNKRKIKGELKGPGQSHSNLWFVDRGMLDRFGPAIGSGSVWLREPVAAGAVSDPYLLSGYRDRSLWITTGVEGPVRFALETEAGDGRWTELKQVSVAGSQFVELDPKVTGAWIRLRALDAAPSASAVFHYRAPARERPTPAPLASKGLISARGEQPHTSTGRLLVRGGNLRTLAFAAQTREPGQPAASEALYELDADLNLRRSDDAKALAFVKESTPIPENVYTSDEASILITDDSNRRWRLPKSLPEFEQAPPLRICREVCTERDLLQVHGTFYELPAKNAGGIAKIRPVATHDRIITDYASYRGLLVLAGVDLATAPRAEVPAGNQHIVRSEDGKAALWVGTVDDLWTFGAPQGHGGPWHKAAVKAGDVSDPYLFRGYNRRQMTLSAGGGQAAKVTVELDLTGEGDWVSYQSFDVPAGEKIEHAFPPAVSAFWLRLKAETAGEITSELKYD